MYVKYKIAVINGIILTLSGVLQGNCRNLFIVTL